MKKISIFLMIISIISLKIYALDFGSKNVDMWELSEWSVTNSSYSGNAFDVVADVTFNHSSSGKTVSTEMFYAGSNTWKFRFTGMRSGTWTFTTSSSDGDLNGHSGSVIVSTQTNDLKGFLVNEGNKFAIQTEDDQTLEAYLFNLYSFDTGGYITSVTVFDGNTSDKTKTYTDAAKKNGMNGIFITMNNNWLNWGTDKWTDHDSEDPDLYTFEVLDSLLIKAQNEGIHVHFWVWGDRGRKWDPPNDDPNSTIDRRLQRYQCARLGAIPNWSMSYGFDLMEWVSGSELDSWASYMQDHMDYPHLLTCRSYHVSSSIDNIINSYSINDQEMGDYYQDGFPSVTEIMSDLAKDNTRPHLYAERHVLNRFTDADETRQLIWRCAIAGGMGGWWGASFGEDPVFGSGSDYPNPEELRTADTFWNHESRFMLDMTSDNNKTDGYCLRSDDHSNYVFYKENTSSIQMDLSSFSGTFRAIAVDCKDDYSEIDITSEISQSNTTWSAPHSSDWAIAVGNFNTIVDNSAPSIPSNLSASSDGFSIDLSWSGSTDSESGISGYKIYRGTSSNPTDLLTTVGNVTEYSDNTGQESTTFYYRIKAVNGASLESDYSSTASATTDTDNTPPTISSVSSVGNKNSVTVVFSEAVSVSTAEDVSNYSLSNGISISSASLSNDSIVTLTVSDLTGGQTYTLTVNNVEDVSSNSNTIAANTTSDFEFIDELIVTLSDYYGSDDSPTVVEDGFVEGSDQVNDRSDDWENVPTELSGLTYLLTARDDKSNSIIGENEVMYELTLSSSATVYCLVDGSPSWLSTDGWELTAISGPTGNSVVYDVYKKVFDAGTIGLKRFYDGGSQGTGYVFEIYSGSTDTEKPNIFSNVYRINLTASPNPFNPSTVISIRNPGSSNVSDVVIYDIKGRAVSNIALSSSGSRHIKAVWDASDFSSGLYVVSVKVGQRQLRKKIMLMK